MEEQKQPASHLVNVPECCRQASEQLYTVSCSLLKNGIFAKIHYSCHLRKQKDGFYSCLPRLFHTAPSSHTKNTFRSSIFHLLECISLIVRCIDWWKMRFLCHLSSTPIFHLPPAVLGGILVVTIWKTNEYIQFIIRSSL